MFLKVRSRKKPIFQSVNELKVSSHLVVHSEVHKIAPVQLYIGKIPIKKVLAKSQFRAKPPRQCYKRVISTKDQHC